MEEIKNSVNTGINTIHAVGVKKTFGDNEVLRGVDLDVAPGEVIAVIGPSGSGKSTLLRCLIGLETVSDGSIFIDGLPFVENGRYVPEKKAKQVRSGMGMVFQSFNLFSHMSVRKNMILPPTLAGRMNKEQALEKAQALLAQVGLSDKLDAMPSELSGGQKRRVAIAGVLAMHPKVLVLDEPTAGLDPKGRDDILDQIAYLHKQSDMTVILVSHSMEDIARYADRIVVMNKGAVMYNGTPKEVFAHYQELEKIGLAAPQVTYIMHDLKEKGLPVKVNVTTVKEATDEIMRELEKKI